MYLDNQDGNNKYYSISSVLFIGRKYTDYLIKYNKEVN